MGRCGTAGNIVFGGDCCTVGSVPLRNLGIAHLVFADHMSTWFCPSRRLVLATFNKCFSGFQASQIIEGRRKCCRLWGRQLEKCNR